MVAEKARKQKGGQGRKRDEILRRRPQVINKKGDLSTVFAISAFFMQALSEIITYFAADKY